VYGKAFVGVVIIVKLFYLFYCFRFRFSTSCIYIKKIWQMGVPT
jgi:hypothetical protein